MTGCAAAESRTDQAGPEAAGKGEAEKYAEDMRLVERDLRALKELLEK
jgi:hypothetical protein